MILAGHAAGIGRDVTMGRYRISRHIRATPAEVFRALTDRALVVDWMDASGLNDATGPLDQPGTMYTLAIFRGWGFRTKVVRVEPLHVHETEGRGPLGAWYRNVATLTPAGPDTDFELVTEYRLPFGAFGR